MPGILFVLIALVSGCATQTNALLQSPAQHLPRQTELVSTPFFPQERYQCGPAALATSLQSAGIPATPDALVSQVYVPAREGSLQTEMLAAGRRNGALSMVIPPTLEALLTEVAAGTPVVILQNLSLPWIPLWHYAVVIGYDLDEENIVLRSGTTKREVMRLSTFERTWARGDYWGMVTMPPGKLPRTVSEDVAVAAVVAFEKEAQAPSARLAYETALQRWPHNLMLQLGYGNAAYAVGDRAAAAAVLKEATRAHPDSVPALNNLATVLSELGQLEQAHEAAERAVALGGPWHQEAVATLRSIETKRKTATARQDR